MNSPVVCHQHEQYSSNPKSPHPLTDKRRKKHLQIPSSLQPVWALGSRAAVPLVGLRAPPSGLQRNCNMVTLHQNIWEEFTKLLSFSNVVKKSHQWKTTATIQNETRTYTSRAEHCYTTRAFYIPPMQWAVHKMNSALVITTKTQQKMIMKLFT